ncbi:gustatory receptor for sugar taste 64e isoform X3 [Stomoxys calcitrans]|uniref:gustatory receptor for sugar taste 64e isoform X3 n=1 Tax=Stomoxys calcitrans TaxID=35570 RepID=UPI0027E39A55|nr:gustatory receptor for sugar taste 64e isoform X3 [Stomoxys calcitrans]
MSTKIKKKKTLKTLKTCKKYISQNTLHHHQQNQCHFRVIAPNSVEIEFSVLAVIKIFCCGVCFPAILVSRFKGIMKFVSCFRNFNSSERHLLQIKFWKPHEILSSKHDSLFYKIKSANVKQSQRKAIIMKLKHQILRRGQKQDYLHVGSFQEAIRPVLLMAQVFALMPVNGISSNSAQDLKFSWTMVRTWYSFVITVCFGICSGFNIVFAFRGVFSFDSVEGIMFYTSIFLIALIFFRMSQKWPSLMQQWQQVEQALPQQSSEMERSWLAHRIKMVLLVATTCSLTEHLLSILTIVYYVNRCPRFNNQPIDSFLFSNFTQFFYFFEYTTIMGILGKIINVYSTFAWSFNDVFVMCLCLAMTAKFRQLNDFMAKYVKKPTSRAFWIERRRTYRMLCRLCGAVDDTIAVATLLCLSNNLYFICNKILKSLQKKPSFTHTLYFWYSLIFLIFRTFIFALWAAAIHEESKRPLVIFRKIHREYWCSEVSTGLRPQHLLWLWHNFMTFLPLVFC